jgi:hypothetical protein
LYPDPTAFAGFFFVRRKHDAQRRGFISGSQFLIGTRSMA